MKKAILVVALALIFNGINAQNFIEEQEMRGIAHVFEHSSFNGGGIAFVDIDNDGDDDAYINGGRAMDKLYINDGNGFFTDITSGSGLEMTDTIYTATVNYGDVDNDGDQDIFVCTHATDNIKPWSKNLLFINNGDLTFTEVWSANTDISMSMGAVFIDYDLDGDLDIYNVNYVEDIKFLYDDDNNINGFDHNCFGNYMYRNDGNLSFTDVTDELGLGDTGCALVVTATDYDLDGDLDILIGNDFGPFIQPNKLYRNDLEDGVFTEVSVETHADSKMFSMGIAVGDYDNDLDLDYYVSNMSNNVLLENEGDFFTDVASLANVENTYAKDSSFSISWGTLFADIDNDMFVDLFVSNGYVPSPEFINSAKLEKDALYMNNGDKTFTLLDTTHGIINLLPARGAAYSDIDNDGRLDIFSVVYDKPGFGLEGNSCLYLNRSQTDNNFLKVSLEGTDSNKNAFGSKVYIYSGQDALLQEASGGSSFCSQNSSILHFGIGDHTNVDSVKVVWPRGKTSKTVYEPTINTRIHIVEEKTTSVSTINNLNVSITPNPVQEFINLDFDSSINQFAAEILDGNGRKILEVENRKKISLKELTAGIYYVKIRTDKGSTIKKIVKVD